MALSWVTIENAIHDWLRLAVGVPVVFSEQSAPQTAMPYCTVRIEGPYRLTGMDELRSVTNLGNALGEEIEQTITGPRELVVSVQAFTTRTVQVSKSWAATTNYFVGDLRQNGNNSYRCITQGQSAGAGGPTGTGADITDGTVHWTYVEDARTARELLAIAQANLDLPSVQGAFDVAGLVVVEKENIHNTNTVLESKWQGRASFDVRLRTTDSVVEKTGYVDGIIISPPPTYT